MILFKERGMQGYGEGQSRVLLKPNDLENYVGLNETFYSPRNCQKEWTFSEIFNEGLSFNH